MAKITGMGAAATAGGILMPMRKNQWRIDTVSTLTEAELDILTLQSVSLKYKFKATDWSFGIEINQRHELQLVVEECISNMIAPIATKLMSEPFDLSYVHLNGDTTPLKTTTFKNCIGLGYEYSMDYAKSETCSYPLKFTFEEVIYS